MLYEVITGRLILLADEFQTFIKVTQKNETDKKILTEERNNFV